MPGTRDEGGSKGGSKGTQPTCALGRVYSPEDTCMSFLTRQGYEGALEVEVGRTEAVFRPFRWPPLRGQSSRGECHEEEGERNLPRRRHPPRGQELRGRLEFLFHVPGLGSLAERKRGARARGARREGRSALGSGVRNQTQTQVPLIPPNSKIPWEQNTKSKRLSLIQIIILKYYSREKNSEYHSQ